jgi:fructokinase
MNPIVGIGEVLWDVYPDGRKVAGGAPFNFAFHCHQLGHPAVIVSRVGDDDLGRELRARVSELGLSDEYIQTDPEHPTGTVQVTLDANKVPTYTITEYVAWDHIAWEEQTARLMYAAPAVCFGTLVQRSVWSSATLDRLLSNAYGFVGREQQLDMFPWVSEEELRQPVVVCDLNIRQKFYDITTIERSLRGSNWCKLNEEELALLVGVFDLDWRDDDFVLAALSRFKNWGKKVICLTRGGNGCFVHTRREVEADEETGATITEEDTFTEPGVPAKVVDTVGAGDAFTAAMVCLHLEGKPLRECARFAVHYAARVCEQPGGTPRIDRAEVERRAFGT